MAVFHNLVEGDFEPFGIAFRVGGHVLLDGFKAHVFPGGYLVGVDVGEGVGLAEPHVVVFVFDETESDGGLIYKGEDLVHFAGHPHLFHESAGGGGFKAFSVLRVAATGVGPQAGGVVFGEGSLLEQQLAFTVEDEDGEGAVEAGHEVGGHFLHDAHLGVSFID